MVKFGMAKKWRVRLADLMDTGPGRVCCGVVIALLIFSPAIVFKLPGFMLVIGAIFGCWGGYSFARHEWRRLGFVPRYDDTADREAVNGSVPSKSRHRPQRQA